MRESGGWKAQGVATVTIFYLIYFTLIPLRLIKHKTNKCFSQTFKFFLPKRKTKKKETKRNKKKTKNTRKTIKLNLRKMEKRKRKFKEDFKRKFNQTAKMEKSDF